MRHEQETGTASGRNGREPRVALGAGRSRAMYQTRGIGRQALFLLVASIAAVLLATVLAARPAPAETRTLTNPTPIEIRESTSALPYPSEIAVSGMSGPITDVNVTLHRVGHRSPNRISVILESPSGYKVEFMFGNCGVTDIEDFTWIFDQQAANPMPRDGSSCPDFVYRPNTSGAFVVPGNSLNDFNNELANGTWKLYVYDVDINNEDGSGDIEGGWSLSIETGPMDLAIPGNPGTSGPANPYPATRTVSGAAGVVTDLNVTIDGIWHQNPDDLDLLLVGPTGQGVVLMSDACGSYDVNAYGWVWDDEAPALMPDGDHTNACGTRFHRPADYDAGETWPAPAPPQPYSAVLSAFDGTNPNREWRLFVNDDSSGNTGFFTNRFGLGITRDGDPPSITPLSPNPGARVRDQTPLIQAQVTDTLTDLSKSNTELFVDGKQKTNYSYDASTDLLEFQSRKLGSKRHSVKVVAADAGGLSATETWTFRVVGRR